ncbi:competence type IV pilus minor pilin ComGG [Streptococcus agalactiae]|uniref:competence type IV pilus minor pilin ComGG n=1 Tax=Streptococcus agalactiae TaxID=1311 RepID=UPI00376F0BD8
MILKKKLKAGILLQAIVLAAVFTLVLQFYLARILATERQYHSHLRKQEDKIVTFGKSNKDDFRKTGYNGRGYQPMVYGLDNCQMSQTKSMVKLVFYFKDGLKRTFYYDFKEET